MTSATQDSIKTDEWLDIAGNGDLKKKIIKQGVPGSHPKRGDLVTVSFICHGSNGDVIEQNKSLSFNIGDKDVIEGLDLAVNLMELGEQAKVLIPSELAYGQLGRNPSIPPDSDLECDIELLEVKELDKTNLTLSELLRIGNEKLNRGNFFFERGEHCNALHCYLKAAEYLDNVDDCSHDFNEEIETALDLKIKIQNNITATYLKVDDYGSALISVDSVNKLQAKCCKALLKKGKELADMGLSEEAAVTMKKAASLESDHRLTQRQLTNLIIKNKVAESSRMKTEQDKSQVGKEPEPVCSKSYCSYI